MVKNSIGELKISPLKEDGMFVFINDFITINGKVSKEDSIKIFVAKYSNQSGEFALDMSQPSKAKLTVRGKESVHENLAGYETLDKLYDHVSSIYKELFYFGEISKS